MSLLNAGIEMDRRTNGPVVFENMQTSVPGIFACGNVVHVHDLVDFVTAESEKAGRSAAEYILNGEKEVKTVLDLACGNHVTYTVPQHIRLENVTGNTEVSFRVNRSFDDSAIIVKAGDKQIAKFTRTHMAPGEMEHISLPKVLLDRAEGQALTVSCEEA